MWDFHWDVAYYDEVVARELGNPIFANEAEVHEVIASPAAKGLLEDKETEFLFGGDDN